MNNVLNKTSYFEREINYIKDQDIKDSLIFMLEKLPDYFYVIPASSTGKYHPKFAASDNGLVKHTKVAVRIAYELFQDETICKFSKREQDLIIMALVLHDGLKSGLIKERYTKVEHPLLIANYIKDNKENLKLTDNDIDLLCRVISSHMGPWNKDFNGNVVLPVPKTALERFVHMCDYLSSKKFLDVEFDGLNIKY